MKLWAIAVEIFCFWLSCILSLTSIVLRQESEKFCAGTARVKSSSRIKNLEVLGIDTEEVYIFFPFTATYIMQDKFCARVHEENPVNQRSPGNTLTASTVLV